MVVPKLVVLPVVIPLFAAIILMALKPLLHRRRLGDVIAVIAALATTAISAILLNASRHDTIVYWLGNWTPRQGIALGISFTVDPIGAGLAVVSGVLTLAALVFSLKYFDAAGTLYHVLMLVFLAAMSGFSLSGDAFNMFVLFELMSTSAFALCGYKTEERESLQGAANFAVTNTVGAFLLLDGIALLYARTGALNLAQIGESLGSTPDALILMAFVLISAGFLIKGAIVPFHLWLADAHAVAPTPVCVLFSGVMVELGLYAVARFYWTVFSRALPPSAFALQSMLIILGATTAIVGGIMCFAQRHLKRLLAFSTISHMGVLLMGIGLMTPGAMGGLWIYLVGHSFAKAALFLGTGILLHRFQTVDELELKGRCWISPSVGLIFIGGGLALAGLPPFATFFGASELEEAAKSAGYRWIPFAMSFAAILTGGAVLRTAGRIWLGLGPGSPAKHVIGTKDETERPAPISPIMTVPAFVLIAAAIVVGIPHSLRTDALRYSIQMQESAAYAARVLYAQQMPVVIADESSIAASAVAKALLLTMIAAALAWFVLSHRFRPLRRAMAVSPAQAAMNGLRSLHSGVIGDYVVWIVAGVVVIGIGLMLGMS